MSHDDKPQPVGRPQGGARSPAGRAAYWRMNYESAIGALADLIAEHTETVEECDAIRAERDQLRDERAKAPRHSTGTDTGGPCCECCYDVYRLRAERDRLRAEVARLQVDLDHAWAVANGEARR